MQVIYICMYVFMCVCVCVCGLTLYVYIYIYMDFQCDRGGVKKRCLPTSLSLLTYEIRRRRPGKRVNEERFYIYINKLKIYATI